MNENDKVIVDTYFSSIDPLVLKSMPKKWNKKVIVITYISCLFEFDKVYSEPEINTKLKQVYSDYVMLRRYLVDLKLLERDTSGKEYKKINRG